VAEQLKTPPRSVRVAIIGAGPAGFYAAGALLQQNDVPVTIDLFEQLPAPYGLVRYGVAPDHQKIKAVTKVFDRTAADSRFRFWGNVRFGVDLTHADLRRHYDQIVYAVGAQADRKLNIPGEDLAGSLSATEFVAWYNGHPAFIDLPVDLRVESAVVIGVGNVAMDVARILARTPAELAPTDITELALQQLAASTLTEIHLVARRGPAQVKFTPTELKELGELADADLVVDPAALQLDPVSAAQLATDAEGLRNLEHLHHFAQRPLTGKRRCIHFHFLASPVELLGQNGRVTAVRIEQNDLQADQQGNLRSYGTGVFHTLPAQLVLRAVGYASTALPGVPFDARAGLIPNQAGRVIDPQTGQVVPGEYVVGWAKRGPTGVIGTNKPDAVETVQQMLADVARLPGAPVADPAALATLLRTRQVQFVDFAQWRKLDALEQANGAAAGQPRRKFIRVPEMLAQLA
jgi:ferredoxin/flavodoxin---NADP+ reductase